MTLIQKATIVVAIISAAVAVTVDAAAAACPPGKKSVATRGGTIICVPKNGQGSPFGRGGGSHGGSSGPINKDGSQRSKRWW